MLKQDRLLVEHLASGDEPARIAAAQELETREKGHFEDHPVSHRIVMALQAGLVAAHADTSSALVKKWVTQVLADGSAKGEEIDALVLEALEPECTYLPTLLYYVSSNVARFGAHKEKIKALCGHADEQVRWRCALVLSHMPQSLSYEIDAACLRVLALDSYYSARTHAVLALRTLGIRSSEDLQVLRQVLEIDDGAAAHYARELLAQHGTEI